LDLVDVALVLAALALVLAADKNPPISNFPNHDEVVLLHSVAKVLLPSSCLYT
jgi:hypothetical protein